MRTVARLAAVLSVSLAIAAQNRLERGQVLCTGRLEIAQTDTADLDDGRPHAAWRGPGGDLWYQAVSEQEAYLTPRNGSSLSSVSPAPRGYVGCLAATYTQHQIPVAQIRPPAYVCVRTDAGRLAEIRVDEIYAKYPVLAPAHKTVSLTYTTWQD
jgi:hypothetical protein